jgi:hypothetical protein
MKDTMQVARMILDMLGTLPTAGYCKGSPCNEKRNLISMNWIFYAKLVNRMKQESVRLLLHPIHLH